MGKRTIRLTESDIRKVVNNVVLSLASDYDIPKQPIDEAVLYSYPARSVMMFISNKYGLVTSKRKFDKVAGCEGAVIIKKANNHCNVILLVIKQGSPKRNAIVRDMETCCGWMCARPFDPQVDGYEGWQFESKPNDNNADDLVYGRKFIYHLCPQSRLKKILAVGLVPKRTTWGEYKIDVEFYKDKNGTDYGWKTVDRVYAFLGKPSRGFLKTNRFNEKEVFTDSYVLLRIETDKIQSPMSDSRPHFYSDPRADGCVFCVSNIPREALSVVETK